MGSMDSNILQRLGFTNLRRRQIFDKQLMIILDGKK